MDVWRRTTGCPSTLLKDGSDESRGTMLFLAENCHPRHRHTHTYVKPGEIDRTMVNTLHLIFHP